MATYRDAPSLAPAVPRRLVRRPEAPGALRWIERVMYLLMTLVSAGALLYFGLEIAVPLTGTVSAGTVTSRFSQTDAKTGRLNQKIRYEYAVDGLSHQGTGSAWTSEAPRRTLEVGEHVEVRSLGVGAWRHAVIGRRFDMAGLVALLLGALFGAAGVAVSSRLGWVAPLRDRWLCRWGQLSPGVIVARHGPTRQGAPYRVEYTFTLPGGARRQGSARVSSRKLFDAVARGQSVTVLHPADRSSPSLVYECGDYRWADEPAGGASSS